MFSGDREQYIGITHGPNKVSPEELSTKLQRLDEQWKSYREFGPGRVLSENRAQVIYMLAKYLTVSRGSGMDEDEVVARVGFSYEDCRSKLKSLKLTGHQEAGLWKRVDGLTNFAEGIKPIRKFGSRRTGSLLARFLKKIPEVSVDIKVRRRK